MNGILQFVVCAINIHLKIISFRINADVHVIITAIDYYATHTLGYLLSLTAALSQYIEAIAKFK